MLIAQMSKSWLNFCSDGYFEFWAKNLQKGVKLCSPDEPFFGSMVSDLWLIE